MEVGLSDRAYSYFTSIERLMSSIYLFYYAVHDFADLIMEDGHIPLLTYTTCLTKQNACTTCVTLRVPILLV